MSGIWSHRVTILGREFQVRSPIPPEKVTEIEQFVNDRLYEVAAKVADADPQAVASLAMLNLAGDYLRLLEESKQQAHGAERLRNLIRQVDRGI